MNNKTWHWRKRSNENTIFATDKVVNPSTTTKDETKIREKPEVESLEREGNEDLGKEASDEKVTAIEDEKIQKDLEGKLRETSKRVEDLTIENTSLKTALLVKEKSFGDMLKRKHQADAELSTIMARLDSTEKENAFLRYEFHMLEKELEIREEEIKYSRQYADASSTRYLETVEKVSKLEGDCQRLHFQLQKKSPSSTCGLVRRETDMRRLLNPQVSDKSMGLMIKRLQDLHEENKALKRILTKKNSELENSRFMYAQIASRLSQAEILLRKLFKDHKSTSDGLAFVDRNQKKITDTENDDMSLVDDLVEMEKRAIVLVDTPKRGNSSDTTGRELVPVEQDIGFIERKQETQSFNWLQIVLNAIIEQSRISKRGLDELFEDIKIALGYVNHPKDFKSDSIHRIIELIEGIALKSFMWNSCPDDCLEKNQHSEISQTPTFKEYFVHVFQWRVSDLNPLLHRFLHTCKDLLTGQADFEKFAEELAFALDWTINSCGTPTNASTARNKIKTFCSPLEDQCVFFNMKNNQSDLTEEHGKLSDELRTTESAKKNLEAVVMSVTEESCDLRKQLGEAKNSIGSLKSELEALEESKGTTEDQFEKQKMINEDLDTQLTIAHSRLNDISERFSSLEDELEDKKKLFEELEATCLELQLQLENMVKKESPTCGRDEVDKIYQTVRKITTASAKMAELLERVMAINPTHKKNSTERACLRAQIQAEDDTKAGFFMSPHNAENETTGDVDVQKPPLLDQTDKSSVQERDVTSEKDDRNLSVRGGGAIVKHKKQGFFDFMRKLLVRRKKGKGKGYK